MLGTSRGERFGKPRPPRPLRQFLLRLLRLLAVLLLVYTLLSAFFLDSAEVGSVSMEPHTRVGDRLLTSPIVYGAYLPLFDGRVPGFRAPRRGEVVTVLPPYAEEPGFFRRVGIFLLEIPTGRRAGNALAPETPWAAPTIRRVIAVPGDTIRMDDFTFYVRTEEGEPFVNEFELAARSYDVRIEELPAGWRDEDPFSGRMEEISLGENEYFVAGDNRNLALDSRDYGVVSGEAIRHVVLMRYWPLRDFGRLGP